MKMAITADQLLAQMQQLKQVALAEPPQGNSKIEPSARGNFGNLLSAAIGTVNQYQMESSKLASQIETGDGGVSLVKAMIASQKASVAFQATVQVRNRVVSAYQDIMNMPI